ncbi:T9SS type A sorting domain-containing protein [Algoriphagus vanfongensis]|uniref:T9SS type A sorting domain-containing protein n=1 Tax=Algoriphagus vanfongensis TaxID=426371 RepID=UPI0003F67D40|nr:T9SS type A sorting domain-containing protein [Algoriphagus vanfongensis]
MGNKARIYLIFALLLIQTGVVKAQFVQFSAVPHHKIKVQDSKYQANFRTSQLNSLPFWDDFSQGLDTLKWTFEGATYSESVGNSAPSLGVILMDGVDALGTPYSREVRDQGAGDYITSREFDLSTLSPAEQSSLYLSFFWQAGGKAERPDENDKLTLQFLNASGQWITVNEIAGGIDKNPEEFNQEIISVDSEFIHEAFQFRFVNMGRLAGPFDSWLIDYVYFNSGRTASDLTYLDRALTQPNYFQFGNYSSIPAGFLASFDAADASTIQNEFYNLENRFRAMEYSIAVSHLQSGASEILNLNTPFNPVPLALERRGFESREINALPQVSEESDYEILTYLTTGDRELFTVSGQNDTTSYSQLDYRLNDTVRTVVPLRDFFAYDHGRADYAAGINQKSGRIAVQYEIEEAVFLKGISFNFTNANQVDLPIDILVWQELDREPIFQKEVLIPAKESLEELQYFSLDTNIQVTGQFYVGFAQFTNDFIHVGLGKSNDQADKIYYNINGAWAQNEQVRGALMIRPHISFSPPFEQTEEETLGFKLYPNPVINRLSIDGKFEDLKVFDSFGREIFLEREGMEKGEILNFSGQRPGVYVIRLLTKTGAESFRILVR